MGSKSLLMVTNMLDSIKEENPMVKENILGKVVIIMRENLKMGLDRDSVDGIFLQKSIMKEILRAISSTATESNILQMEIFFRANFPKELRTKAF